MSYRPAPALPSVTLSSPGKLNSDSLDSCAMLSWIESGLSIRDCGDKIHNLGITLCSDNVEISSDVIMMCMAQLLNSPNKVPQALLRYSRAVHQKLKVTEVKRNDETGTFEIASVDDNNNEQRFAGYDALILAIPLMKGKTKIKFGDSLKPVAEDSLGEFHRTVATFVRGQPRFANWCSDLSDCPTDIMGCGPNWKDFYSSLGLLAPVSYEKGESVQTCGKFFILWGYNFWEFFLGI